VTSGGEKDQQDSQCCIILASAFWVGDPDVCGQNEGRALMYIWIVMQIESNYLCGKLKCITAYYGDLVIPASDL
jgi:hypothetical protein